MAAVPPTIAVPSPHVTREFNTDYFKTTEGQLRAAKGVLSLAALISTSEGYCHNDTGRFGFSLFIMIVSLLQAILVIVMFVLRLDKKFHKQINIPLSLFINDGTTLVIFFIISTLALLSIGRCDYMMAARIIAALFVLSLFLVLVGLLYLDYISWQESLNTKEHSKEMGTTITESSPTVLT